MFAVTVSVIALEALTLLLWHLDRSRMLNAVIARTPVEFQKLQGKAPKPAKRNPDLIDAFELPDGF
jgi:hypothetical protein